MPAFKIPAETKPAIWGAIGGAVVLAIVGFSWGGWVTGSTADQRAKTSADSAVVAALAPFCVDKFRQDAAVAANLVELKKVGSWQQSQFVEKGGWATLPGKTSPDSSVARACADILAKA